MRHVMLISRIGMQSERISDWLVGWRADNRPAISGLHPTTDERHGHEQRSAIALKLIFGYRKYRPSNIVVKHSTEGGGGDSLGTKGGALLKRSKLFCLFEWCLIQQKLFVLWKKTVSKI